MSDSHGSLRKVGGWMNHPFATYFRWVIQCWTSWEMIHETYFWLVVSTPLKNISQNGNLPQVGVKIKNVWNRHLEIVKMGIISPKSGEQVWLWIFETWSFHPENDGFPSSEFMFSRGWFSGEPAVKLQGGALEINLCNPIFGNSEGWHRWATKKKN